MRRNNHRYIHRAKPSAGLKKRFKSLEIDWEMVDSHMEGLSALFSKRRKITLNIEFI